MSVTTLTQAACRVLGTADASEKASLTAHYAAAWRDGTLRDIGDTQPPVRPSRPAKPDLLMPRDMPKRGLGSDAGRAAFVHAIAHIELNAIDLAWDLVARFVADDMPRSFYDDWVRVADDEARHFVMLSERMAEMGYTYGDFPAHDGLWQAAEATTDDIAARLALVPMVLEARGLDTVPDAVHRLEQVSDDRTAAILKIIGKEEVPHVAAGTRWFDRICRARGIDPVETFHALVKSRYNAKLKPPFNEAARTRAGMASSFYAPLASS